MSQEPTPTAFQADLDRLVSSTRRLERLSGLIDRTLGQLSKSVKRLGAAEARLEGVSRTLARRPTGAGARRGGGPGKIRPGAFRVDLPGSGRKDGGGGTR